MIDLSVDDSPEHPYTGTAISPSFGYYTKLTDRLNGALFNAAPINTSSVAYKSGLYGSAAFSGFRLLYAGSASAIQYIPGITAAEAVATRNTLKGIFSTLGADHPRAYTLSDMMAKYGSEAEVIKAASRSNADLNTAAAAVVATGYAEASDCK